MFYQLIQRQRELWYNSKECTVKDVVGYIENKKMMRDAQVEAIKTYLYLKVACRNRPLWQLYHSGVFNTLDFDKLCITGIAHSAVKGNKAAAALLEYSLLKDRKGKQIAPQLQELINYNVEELDFEQIFRDIFYGVDYPDYLFSLPMGAGKTYLMAAFIYLDLYFAMQEPENPVFAHNFMIMVPSGLKTSILPSLKDIRNFDPTWVLPEPAASQLRRIMKFEVLDEESTAKKSNMVRNPNAQKLNLHLSAPDLMGLVAVTNAEKVILNHLDNALDTNTYISDEMKKEWEKVNVSNELRNIISRIPNLAIYIDEVHHAGGDQKLRQVVNGWSANRSFCGMLGFSGTPYLEKASKIVLDGKCEIKNSEFSNIVYYYPLIDGIDNFLKHPEVYQTEQSSEFIVREGVGMFIDRYWNKVYSNGTKAKLAIYCGGVETLEETVFPVVSELLMKRGINVSEVVLKYHKGSSGKSVSGKKYPEPEGAALEFAALDTPLSKKRIILLVQIGKEGWNCRSLTGVILPHKNSSPTNMVLQTSCRCLRQVERGVREDAVIWLNAFNAGILNKQLQQQQDITLQEFTGKRLKEPEVINRYSRMDVQKVPSIDFYQLHIKSQTEFVEREQDIAALLQSETIFQKADDVKVYKKDFSGNTLDIERLFTTPSEKISYNIWLHTICKESFGTLTMEELRKYTHLLKSIFSRVTLEEASGCVYDRGYNQPAIRSRIRQCFMPLREYNQNESMNHESFSLLKYGKLESPCEVVDIHKYFPSQKDVEEIISWDRNPKDRTLSPEELELFKKLEALGHDMSSLRPSDPHPERKFTYHYLPYHFDSDLERDMFTSTLSLDFMKEKGLELYYNGDENLTDFRIECYNHDGRHWHSLGNYYPDFVLLQRRNGSIHKVMVIETKGDAFAQKFKLRRRFMDESFIPGNNEIFFYQRFSFLYLEDSVNIEENREKLLYAVKSFFKD